jgi:hypothetical protein
VVALVASILVAVVSIVGIVLYGRRRPVGAPLSWGEAIAAATFGFFLMFWAYGVIPHQWLAYSGNELSWRPDKILLESGRWELFGIPIPPFTINYENLAHTIVVIIYGVFLGIHVWLWVFWQNRGKEKPVEIETTAYGRPLVRQG